MGRRPINWTYERDLKFKQMWNLGTQLPQIADYFGCSVTAAKKHRMKLGLRSRQVARMKLGHEINVRFTQKQWDRIAELAEQGGMTKARIIRLAIERFTGHKDDE